MQIAIMVIHLPKVYNEIKFHHNSVFYVCFQVYLDEINTACCLGLFKELITDKTLNGNVSNWSSVKGVYAPVEYVMFCT